MELKVGMYLRCSGADDEYPIIQKITKLESPGRFGWKYKVFTDKCGFWFIDSPDIEIEKAKYSFDIIDLIEVCDIISFYEDIDNYKKEYAIRIIDLIMLDEVKDKILNDNIRLISIVTKEQFEQMEYRIGE